MLVFELLRGEAIDRGPCCPIDEILQGSLLSNGLGNGEQYQCAKGQQGFDLRRSQINTDLTDARKMCYNHRRAEQTRRR